VSVLKRFLRKQVSIMKVKDIMTPDPACCVPNTTLQEVAKMMVDNDCGEIPVVENEKSRIPVGVITDRDITCRAVANNLLPAEARVGDHMTVPCVTVMPDMSLKECEKIMEEKQIRRVPVVDAGGACVGIVALADIVLQAARRDAAEVIQEVSKASGSASNV
jgi:CBS domain-containing protein